VFKEVMQAESNPIIRKTLWDQYCIIVRCREVGHKKAKLGVEPDLSDVETE
jgi:hypothetical protein